MHLGANDRKLDSLWLVIKVLNKLYDRRLSQDGIVAVWCHQGPMLILSFLSVILSMLVFLLVLVPHACKMTAVAPVILYSFT